MISTRTLRVAAVSAVACAAGLLLPAPAATAGPSHPAARDVVRPSATAPTAPSNLRVTRLTSTSVTFQWDHSRGATGGCTVPLVLYSIFVDGVFRGSTFWGSPVGHVAGLRPGVTYSLTVKGRDNCSGLESPPSEPLVVTTPA